jgi:hypothetical protein
MSNEVFHLHPHEATASDMLLLLCCTQSIASLATSAGSELGYEHVMCVLVTEIRLNLLLPCVLHHTYVHT